MTFMPVPAGQDDDVLLEQQLVLALSVASHAVQSACTPVLQELNLTHPQYLVMLALWEKSPRPCREIDNLLPQPGGLSPVLLQLEESGYIQSVRVQGHNDDSTVNLTAKGQALYRRTLSISGTILGRLGLSQEDAEGLSNAMPRLIKAAKRSPLSQKIPSVPEETSSSGSSSRA
jgi:DNA-binding MarR family transcriptional regulator